MAVDAHACVVYAKYEAWEFFPSNSGGRFDCQRRAKVIGDRERVQVEEAQECDGFGEGLGWQHFGRSCGNRATARITHERPELANLLT